MSRHRIDEVILRQCRHLPSIGIDSRTDLLTCAFAIIAAPPE